VTTTLTSPPEAPTGGPPAGDALLHSSWRVNPQVDLRSESFGALAYDFGTRRLSFLKSPLLVRVVRALADQPTAAAACRAAGVGDDELPRYERALRTLADSGMIVPAPPTPTTAPLAEPPAPAPVAEVVPPDAIAVPAARKATPRPVTLVDRFQSGLDAPICLTWELTYSCNLACAHCLSSSGRRDPRELSTEECRAVIDELERMKVFYVNIGGGEPTIRADFWDLVDYATAHHVGVKFSTNGTRITPAIARRLAASDYVDVQISLDGATAEVNDAVRGEGSYAAALAAMGHLADAGFKGFKISVVMTRHNIGQLDQLKALADRFEAQLRITRLRPSGRGADVWDTLHPTDGQQRELYQWLLAHGEQVLTGDSFFHLAGYGEPLPGLNLCGAGRVVCLIDPVGDVYACPFAIHDRFRAGNVRTAGGFSDVWRHSDLFTELREPQSGGPCQACDAYDACRGGCMAAKFFTGMDLQGPDPECVRGHGLAPGQRGDPAAPRTSVDHTVSRQPVPVHFARSVRACEESPLAGLDRRH
jgi:mycofactocin radical SAM maturase